MTDDPDTSPDDDVSVGDVVAKATSFLSKRGHSEGELRDKLRERDFPEAAIDEACEILRDDGALDDHRFARHQAEILQRDRWGPRQIRHKLCKHGVPESVADDVVDDLGANDGWLRPCWEQADKKFGTPSALSEDDVERAYRHLEHRGFYASTIRRVLFDGEAPESET